MIFGVDVSKYQPTEAVDGWAFAILNCEDPGYRDKIRRCVDQGVIWQPYVWVYPGAPGWTVLDRAKQTTEYAGYPLEVCWADYEEAGVSPDQLRGFFERADEYGVAAGYYANDHVLDHTPFLARPFWLAQYPGANDGTFPGLTYQASRPVEIWQYTSGANDPAGGLDRNVIIDEAWWAGLTGTNPGGSDDVIYRAQGASTTNPDVTDGSLWIVVGQTAQGTVLAKGEGVAGPVVAVPGEQLGLISKFTPTTGEVVTVPADPSTLTNDQLVAELDRRLG